VREVLIVGGGIGGLTLALVQHQRRIPCRVFEALSERYKRVAGYDRTRLQG